jgi:hypothetical protein
MELKISIRSIIKILAVTIIILATISILGQIYKFTIGYDRYFVNLLDLDSENNLPTWYASVSLFFCFILLLSIGLIKKNANDIFYMYWLCLSFIFLGLSLDENIQLHEQTISPLRSLFNSSGIFYFTWVIPAIFLLVFLFLFFLTFLKNLPSKTRNLFLISGALFITGSIGGEFIGGYFQTLYQGKNLSYAIVTNIEEIFEMTGVFVFIYTLLDYMSQHLTDLRIRIINKS